jgi:hypothetical protein
MDDSLQTAADEASFRRVAMEAYRDHVMRALGLSLPAVESAAELIALAKRARADELEAASGWRTEPPFPGGGEQPERMPTGWRMICACRLFSQGRERGVVFTTFVSGRPVTIFVNAPGTLIPQEYTPLAAR